MVASPAVDHDASNSARRDLFQAMLRIRRVEEAIANRYGEQEMRCPVHLSIGQEAAAVGACKPLRDTDRTYSTHRSHAHYLAKGGDMKRMVAEIYGRETGCIGGRGGSMHLQDHSKGIMASIPIVGSSIPLAVGSALSDQRSGIDGVSVCFLGDGAAEEGVFHESMNFAALHKLPVIFFCENNLFSVYTPLDQRQPARSLQTLGPAHGVETTHGDGNDVAAVLTAMTEAVDKARAGGGPSFLVFDTYRHLEHCGPANDDHLGYRDADEVSRWVARDPIPLFKAELSQDGLLDDTGAAAMENTIEAEIKEAFEYAIASPLPTVAQAAAHVYAD